MQRDTGSCICMKLPSNPHMQKIANVALVGEIPSMRLNYNNEGAVFNFVHLRALYFQLAIDIVAASGFACFVRFRGCFETIKCIRCVDVQIWFEHDHQKLFRFEGIQSEYVTEGWLLGETMWVLAFGIKREKTPTRDWCVWILHGIQLFSLKIYLQ